MNFQPIIGLEIHVEMKTKSKMFSSSPNGFSRDPNTHVLPFDMGHPGALPTVNKQAVINALRVANALHMEIAHTLYFDRKHYFYADLPKGYQITQQFHPIGKNGYLEFEDKEGNLRRIHIERIHLEEDSCKQVHSQDCSLLDYNRAGVPLIEIVSLPEIRNGYEAMRYVEIIRNIVVYSLTSDGNMEEGSLRCDVNVSLQSLDSNELGTKVEIKNINAIKNIPLAIDYEIKRQKELLDQGEIIRQETRRFDDGSGKTVLMRLKEDDVDYKYFPEANIAPISLSDEFILNAILTCPELYEKKLERYLSWGLPKVDAEIILSDYELSKYFESAVKNEKIARTICKFLLGEVRGYLNKNGITISQFPLSGEQLYQIAELQERRLSHMQCVDIFLYVCQNGVEVEEAIKLLEIEEQSSDDGYILEYVTQVLDGNPQSIQDFKSGKDRAIGFLIGQVMKLSKGKANPSAVAKIMSQEINKR